jgi:choline monooxygenase
MMEIDQIGRQVAELERRGVEDGVAHGLPRAAYTSEAFHAREQERVFARGWVFAGLAHEIPQAGDVVPVTVAGQPVILLRDGGGEIAAFHNVCRHRGSILVDAPCRGQKVLTCPYHSWAYDLDGSLRATPHFAGHGKSTPPGFDPSRYGLKPVRSATWHDWIFVNIDGNASPIEDHVAPLAKLIAGMGVETMTPVATLDFGAVEANWKLLMENFIEPYHVPVVHPETAGGQPLKGHYAVIEGHCVGAAVDVTAPVKKAGGDPHLDMSARYLTLFPNFVLGVYMPDQMGVHLNIPDGPSRTRQKRVIYVRNDSVPPPDAVAELRDLWRKVHEEDHAICERLQAGRASPVMDDGGVLSPHWETSERAFQKMVLEAVRVG